MFSSHASPSSVSGLCACAGRPPINKNARRPAHGRLRAARRGPRRDIPRPTVRRHLPAMPRRGGRSAPGAGTSLVPSRRRVWSGIARYGPQLLGGGAGGLPSWVPGFWDDHPKKARGRPTQKSPRIVPYSLDGHARRSATCAACPSRPRRRCCTAHPAPRPRCRSRIAPCPSRRPLLGPARDPTARTPP